MASSSCCSLEPLVLALQFKSGAVYEGEMAGGKRSGRGTFLWPSGLQYSGEYAGNKRDGQGITEWPDGSRYEGGFREDLRHGEGRHEWSNGEVYSGSYVRDKRQGRGTYTWPSGAKFEGEFVADMKEGMGTYTSPDRETFKGLYRNDIRDGEGVMSYRGGREDVGVWRGTKIVQLKFSVEEASFSLRSTHPLGSGNSLGTPSWRQRGRAGAKGELEVASEELIRSAAVDAIARVTTILRAGVVHVDVVDSNGRGALFAAATRSHPEVIDVLLDNGADVNRLDSAGLSALTACHHLLYHRLPGVQELLECLPKPLQTATDDFSSSSSSSDCTLFSSDLLSTPPNTPSRGHPPLTPPPSPHCAEECKECNGLCKARSLAMFTKEQEQSGNTHLSGLTEVKSYPLLDFHREKKVRFISIDTFLAHGGKLNPDVNRELFTGIDSTPVETARLNGVEQEKGSEDSLSLSEEESLMSECYEEEKDFELINGRGSSLSPMVRILPPISENNSLLQQGGGGGGGGGHRELSNMTGHRPFASSGPRSMSPSKLLSDPRLYPHLHPASYGHRFTAKGHSQGSTPSPTPYIAIARGKLTPLRAFLQSELHSSSVFSSTKFGSINSAAQSMTLSCGPSPQLDNLSEPAFSPAPFVEEEEEGVMEREGSPLPTPESSICLLLHRGADPNISPSPLPPLFYAIRAGDVEGVKRLLERGASTELCLPREAGGYSPLQAAVSYPHPNTLPIVETLLEFGADASGGRVEGDSGSETESRQYSCEESEEEFRGREAQSNGRVKHSVQRGSRRRESCDGIRMLEEVKTCGNSSVGQGVIAGENEGLSSFSPLHLTCMASSSRQKLLQFPDVVPSVVLTLLKSGAEVNCVARGHSSLSLAIMNGHDTVVEVLLQCGADPGLALGREVGTALCALTTHTAHQNRDHSDTVKLLGKLLTCGADILQPVCVNRSWHPGTIVDYAHEAFKQDKRLSCLRYDALTKPERKRYKAMKKFTSHLVNLLRCKALELIMKDSSSVLDTQSQKRDHNVEKKRPLSATDVYLSGSAKQSKRDGVDRMKKKRRHTCSVGSAPTSEARLLPCALPEQTLLASLEEVYQTHGMEQRKEEEEESTNHRTRLRRRSQTGGVGGKMLLASLQKKSMRPYPWNSTSKKNEEKEIQDDLNRSTQGDRVWTLQSFCYECGSSTGVRLTLCEGCGLVCFCSQSCHDEGLHRGHRSECTATLVAKKQVRVSRQCSTAKQLQNKTL